MLQVYSEDPYLLGGQLVFNIGANALDEGNQGGVVSSTTEFLN
ncbi:MAG TPA: hypothetical protein VFH48_37785 [Chloroflexota bacterium]|nr:hypothetical protein [Chloroflexota bacterium]